MKSDYNWLNIIRFHREIIGISQNETYGMPVESENHLNSSRWVHLTSYCPDSLAGPWTLHRDALTSRPFCDGIWGGNIKEGYLGGPCWLDRGKIRDSWNDLLYPLLYQRVRFETDGDELTIIPLDGRWDFSPVLYDRLEKLETGSPRPLDEMTDEIIDQASLRAESGHQHLTKCIIDEIIRHVPELGGLITERRDNAIFLQNPYPWVIFTDTSGNLAYTRHLLRDYERLEELLKENPEEIGGLRIFEGACRAENDHYEEILPIIPLNREQEEAVISVLSGTPATVIHGPPGCGKSQVVTSVLMNAWACGISVLFSSTTNAAVDVVFNRLRSFDSEIPVAIRAGSRNKNTIDDSLKAVSYAGMSSYRGPDELLSLKMAVQDLESERKTLADSLDKKIPQRIHEAKQLALKACAEYQVISGKAAEKTAPYARKLRLLGYSLPPERFGEEIMKPLDAWYGEIPECRAEIRRCNKQRQELSEALRIAEDERDSAFQCVGKDLCLMGSYGWLMGQTGPEQFEEWATAFQGAISRPAGDYLNGPPLLRDEFKEWADGDEVLRWLERAGETSELISRLLNGHTETLSGYFSLEGCYQAVDAARAEAGISEDEPVDLSTLFEWLSLYSDYCSAGNDALRFLPWSQRNKADKRLRELEKGFLRSYPSVVWQDMGRDPEAGRRHLGRLVETSIEWTRSCNALHDYKKKPGVGEILADLDSVLKSVPELGMTLTGGSVAVSSLTEFSASLRRRQHVAEQAARAYEETAAYESYRAGMVRVGRSFQVLSSESPLLQSWIRGEGSEYAEVASGCISGMSADLLGQARSLVYRRPFRPMLSAWKEARQAEAESEKYRRLFSAVRTEGNILAEWWERMPECALRPADTLSFPPEGGSLWQHISECHVWNEDWKGCVRSDLQALWDDLERLRNDAVGYLRSASENVPPDDRGIIQGRIRDLTGRSPDRWDIPLVNQLFSAYEPERIEAEIAEINARLEKDAFVLAKEYYYRRIREDPGVIDAASDLRRHFRAHSNKIKGFSEERYAEALRGVPVWTTTALSSQSFPLSPGIIDLLVIDEASQCTLTSILPLIFRARRLAIIGDPNQLPAISNIPPAREFSLAARHGVTADLQSIGHRDNNVFRVATESWPRKDVRNIQLLEHFRTYPEIIGFVNQHIYNMELKIRRSVASHRMGAGMAGIFGINIPGSCRRGAGGRSWINQNEADAVCELVRRLSESGLPDDLTIGVVTPFAGQKEMIEKRLTAIGAGGRLTVGTAHTFQGDERDIMIFSPVVSGGMNPMSVKFANNPNLVNVSVTRAREALFFVGDYEACRGYGGIIGELVKYVETVSLLRNTSPDELELFGLMATEGWIPEVHRQIQGIEVDFVLHNQKKGIRLVLEVDGKQHYLVEVCGKRYPVRYKGSQRYVSTDSGNFPVIRRGKQEYAEIRGTACPVIQTSEQVMTDRIRDNMLEIEGYRVLRIRGKEIREAPALVVAEIKKGLETE